MIAIKPPEGRVDHDPAMEDAISRLSKLLVEENAALATMDFAKAGGLLAAKHSAADALASAWRAADAGLPVSDKMRELGRLAEENRQHLKRAMRVQQRVLDLVAKAARATPHATRYSASGKLALRTTNAHSLKAQA